jgi:hypothetical protein
LKIKFTLNTTTGVFTRGLDTGPYLTEEPYSASFGAPQEDLQQRNDNLSKIDAVSNARPLEIYIEDKTGGSDRKNVPPVTMGVDKDVFGASTLTRVPDSVSLAAVAEMNSITLLSFLAHKRRNLTTYSLQRTSATANVSGSGVTGL